MKYLFRYYQKEMGVVILCLSLLAWAIFATIMAMRAETRVILIRSESGLLSVISEETLGEDKLIKANFIRRFLLLTYNFDSHSFRENQEKASDLMSEALFSELKEDLNREEQSMTANYMNQSGEVIRCDQTDQYSFECEVWVWNLKDGRDKKRRVKATLSLKQAERSLENPWGFEVNRFKSEAI